jgi:hypothetical protein
MLNLLDGKSPGYFGSHFYLDYMVTWGTAQGSCLHNIAPYHIHTHIDTHVPMCVFVCLCVVQNSVFFHVYVQVYISN